MNEHIDHQELTDAESQEFESFNETRPLRFEVERRTFIQFVSAGIVISTTFEMASAQRRSFGSPAETPLEARLQIGKDGSITLFTGKVEAGQGSRAQLSQAIAEELHVPVDRVAVIMADTELTPNDGTTAGSKTTPSTVPGVRKAGAAARKVLIDLACKRWGVDASKVETKDGTVVLSGTGKKYTYADLAHTEEVKEAFSAKTQAAGAVTPTKDWKVIGTSVPRPNARDLVTGTHRFASDIVLPGMLYGKVLRAPSYAAKLVSIDLAPAQAMDGVVAVRDGDFVGCAAPTSFLAGQAVAAIAETAKWDIGAHPSSKELFSHLKSHAQTGGGGGSRRSRGGGGNRGSVEEGLAESDKTLDARFEIAYIQHAPMEPRTAMAKWDDGGKLTVWTGSQAPNRVQQELARAFSLNESKVRVIIPDTGGGFGGKHTGEAALEAARLAKAAKCPVSLRWTREEEFTWAYFRPAAVMEIRAGVSAEGKLIAWDYTTINPGSSGLSSPYAVPNIREKSVRTDSPLRQGSYRALASTANNFARETFMDYLAAEIGADPLDFRLANLEPGRLRSVLEAVAKRFDWKKRKRNTDPDIGIGIACGTEKASYVATCVEIKVDRKRGAIEILEVCEAFECGAIQNPDNLHSQVTSCIIMGLGGALTEEILFEDGKILNPRFSEYRVPRFKDVPKLDIVLVDRSDLDSVGAGETPIMGIAPAIANAILDATGEKMRSMPMRVEKIKQA